VQTVAAVTTPLSTLHQREQTRLARTRLGRIASMAADTDRAERPVGTITFIAPQPPTLAGEFPLGCRTRRLDGSNRFKLQLDDRRLAELLGWDDGVLDVAVAQGWALLTQRPEQRGAGRSRNSVYAGFTTGAIERVALRPGHLSLLGLATGGEVLVAPLPDHGALALCNPDLIAALAPPHIARLLAQPAPVAPAAVEPVVAHPAPFRLARTADQGGIR
jgi:hypothetical protein